MKTNRKSAFVIGLLGFFVGLCGSSPAAAKVAVKKTVSGWTMLVDGEPFFVKGVGCNTARGEKGEDYLKLAKDMGANAVRTWGITPKEYFDTAHSYGLKVAAGVWFNPIRNGNPESYLDRAHCAKLKKETLAHVREMKSHPALLCWNLGNEVFAFTESEKEKAAFGVFLEDVVRAVKKEDPHHPVMYAASGAIDFPYLKKWVPSLDIAGANVYGVYGWVLTWLKNNSWDKPVLATEFGPFGEWDRMKDENGEPYDTYDHLKVVNYVSCWKEIERSKHISLGGFAFVIGDSRNQASFTWYNLNFGEKKRPSYGAMTEVYTGRPFPNRAPKIRFLKLDRASNLSPTDQISMTVTVSDPEADPLTYSYFITDIVTDPLVVHAANFFPTKVNELKPGQVKLSVPSTPGLYRVYATVEDNHGNIAVANRSIRVVDTPSASQGK